MKEFSEFREELKTTIFKDDLLERLSFAEALYNLINKEEPVLQDNESLVAAIDAPWGTGKTYFLDLFEETLENANEDEANSPVIVRYNAWENDDFDDPLLSILYCLVKKQMQRKDIKNDLKQQGINVIENVAVPVILNMIKEKTGFDAQKAFEIAKGALDIEHNKSFEKYEEAINKKKAFRDSMKTLSNKNKVIVLIDELDRCRPTYAIELLETIKHYLNVENYTFIFALDKNQLSHSIKTQYGSDMDSSGYLRRFFDYVMKFPVLSMAVFIRNQLASIDLKGDLKKKFINDLDKLAISMQLSTRDMQIIMKSFIILWETILHSQTVNHFMLETYIFLVALKYKMPIVYRNAMDGNGKSQEIVFAEYSFGDINDAINNIIKILINNKAMSGIEYTYIERYLVIAVDDNYTRDIMTYHNKKGKLSEYKKNIYLMYNNIQEYSFPRLNMNNNIQPVSNSAKVILVDKESTMSLGQQLSRQLEMISTGEE